MFEKAGRANSFSKFIIENSSIFSRFAQRAGIVAILLSWAHIVIAGQEMAMPGSLIASAAGVAVVQTEYRSDEKRPLAPIIHLLLSPANSDEQSQLWRPFMMRSAEEAEGGLMGGGSEQHFHGITRSLYNPEYIYAVQDIAGPWRSRDGGITWEKTLDKGLVCRNSDSIEVDPVDPNKLFVMMDNWNGYRPQEKGGIFLSLNGGETWQLVLNIDWNDDYTFSAWDGPHQTNAYIWGSSVDVTGEPTGGFNHRTYTHNITWSSIGVNATSSPTHWFAAFPRDYLYFSSDGGRSWNKGADLSKYQFIYAVETDIEYRDIVYIATEKGLLVSRDGGKTVEERGVWYVHNVPRSSPRDPESLITFPRTEQTRDIFKYMRMYSFVVDPRIPGKFWCVGRWFPDPSVDTSALDENSAREWLFSTTDHGQTWQEATTQPWPNDKNLPCRLFIHPTNGNLLWVTNRWGYVHRYSQDSGLTWSNGLLGTSNPGFGREAEWRRRISGGITGIVPNSGDGNDVVAYSHATFWKSNDGGITFNESATGFNGIAWSWYKEGIAFDRYHPGRIGTFNCDVNVRMSDTNWDYFRSTENVDEINGWATGSNKQTVGQGSHAGAFQPLPDSGVMVATIGEYFKTRLMRSEDAGRTWSLIENLPLPPGVEEKQSYWNGGSIFYVGFSQVRPNRVWAASMVSDDAGQTFRMIDFGLDSKGNAYKSWPMVLGFCQHHPETVYAMGNYGKTIVRSDDSGDTWRTYTNGSVQVPWQVTWFDSQPFFEVDPFNPDIVYIHSKDGGVAMFDGTTWTDIFAADDIPGKSEGNHVRAIAADPTNEGVLYIGCFLPGFDGIWKTTDRGATWENISKNLPRIENSAIKVSPHTGNLYLGSYIGTWVYPAHSL